jgi:hypothetical protein
MEGTSELANSRPTSKSTKLEDFFKIARGSYLHKKTPDNLVVT